MTRVPKVPWAGSAGALHAPGLGKKHRTAPGTGLGSALVQLLTESPSRAGHAEKHLPGLPGLEATSCSPPALFGPSPGLHWKNHSRSFIQCWARNRLLLSQQPQGRAGVPLSPAALGGIEGQIRAVLAQTAQLPLLPTRPVLSGGPARSSAAPTAGGLCSMAVTAPAAQPAPHRGLSPRHDPEPAAWEGNWQPELPAAHPSARGRR